MTNSLGSPDPGDGAVGARPPGSLRIPRPVREPAARLVCFPPSGTAASSFRDWCDRVPAGVEVVAVQYPGREDRAVEPFALDAAALGAGVADEIADHAERTDSAGVPTALFGHSLGALLAYHAARRLGEGAHPAGLLAVAGRVPPWTPVSLPEAAEHDDDALWEELLRLGGVPAMLVEEPELRELFTPLIRADVQLSRQTVRPGSPLDVPVLGLSGVDDPLAGPAEVADWAAATTGTFRAVLLAGGHFFPRTHPDTVLAAILGALAV